jgi:hypothetical protein
VDATSLPLRVVREGAISIERLREVVPGVLDINGNAGDEAGVTAAEAPVESDVVQPDAVQSDAGEKPDSAE